MATSTDDLSPAGAAFAEQPVLPDLDDASAEYILTWAIERFYPDIAVACSMQDSVVVDIAWRIEPRIEVFFLETGFHFPETLETADRLQKRYELNLVAVQPVENPAIYSRDGVEACCAARKVIPMDRHLAGRRAWVSGLRRAESATRAGAHALEWDAKRGLVKVNPIVAWSDEQVATYIADHDLIVNPLLAQGYGSVGCWPCTRAGEGRTGRWAGLDKTECGIHPVSPGPAGPAGGQ
ncbi:MAG TPA: phosphoadenylyl-sulfate reductase [Actinomycetota bacterium]|nr:phosphoadenylyl-sulfate reductase [Actinomycetota bacterium]